MYYDDSRTENRVILAVQVKYDIYDNNHFCTNRSLMLTQKLTDIHKLYTKYVFRCADFFYFSLI